MKTTASPSPVNRIASGTKCAMALQAIRRQQTITEISKNHHCSRTTVYAQQTRALDAATKAFDETDEEVLFTIKVTKAFIHMVVVALYLLDGPSYRGIMFFMETVLGYPIALGSIFNILDVAADKAKPLNDSYGLCAIQSGAADELFHRNQPILSVVDIESRFCALLAQSDNRDHESWAIHLLDLQARGYAPAPALSMTPKG